MRTTSSPPLFDKVVVTLGNATRFTIRKENHGRKITNIAYDGQKIDGWFISHTALMQGK